MPQFGEAVDRLGRAKSIVHGEEIAGDSATVPVAATVPRWLGVRSAR
jgi:hypothetical protein